MNFSNHLHSGAERRILLTETVRGENQFQGCHLLSFLATLIEKQTNGWWSDQYCCLQLIPLPRIGAHLPTSALRDREAWVNISAECAASNFLFFFFFFSRGANWNHGQKDFHTRGRVQQFLQTQILQHPVDLRWVSKTFAGWNCIANQIGAPYFSIVFIYLL